ncbi:phage replisome organizer N-terminal domain-containing protein [Bacillus sp. JJ722]|uniref:phage replisome organizer N-terminal domain-containing protein n=1 Tax=Bacillus sp. JJ722 TaxID=3122973 RepID=UPI002FFF457A
MSDVKWIKLSTHMFDDEKIRLIETMPDADTILVVWIKLLAQAGKTNATGYIYLSENIPYTDEMLATIFNRPIATVRLALRTFEDFGMIEISEDKFISISNWDKHQNLAGLEKIREQTKTRVAKHRQQKSISNVTLHVTHGNATDIEEDIDKNKKENKDIYSNEFEQFWSIYPRKVDKKKAFKSFKTAIKNHSLETILIGTEKYAKQVQKTDKQYIKHPTTFLNNDSFIDGYEEGGTNGTNQGRRYASDYDLPF